MKNTMNNAGGNIYLKLLPLVLCSSAALAAQYQVIDLGTLGGDALTTAPGSGAADVSNSGQVVGTSVVNDADKNLHGFSYMNGILNDLPPVGADIHGMAFAVNDSGNIVGVSYQLGELNTNAVLWNSAGSTTLGSFHPADINNSDVVVGYMPQAPTYAQVHAVRWMNGSLTDLGTLGGDSSIAHAINDQGMIVGSAALADNMTQHAFLWHNGMMSDLGTLGGSGSQAFGLNDSDQVVGVSDTSAGEPHATLFTLNASGQVVSRTDLGVLSNTFSYAYDINDSGQVVGTSDSRAFLWENGTMSDLNNMIPAGSGWLLTKALAINNDGIIVGEGKHNGLPRAFMLVCDILGDLNGDGTVDQTDLGILLAAYNVDGGGDLDGDGDTDQGDLGILLANYNQSCN